MKRKFGLTGALAGAALAGGLLLSACGGGNAGHGGMHGNGAAGAIQAAGSIKVSLVNWAVEPAQASAKAGTVTFHVVHEMDHMHGMAEGGNYHDLQVARKTADGTFEIVGQVLGLRMGDSKNLTLDLAPGDYELQCNATEEINGTVIPHYVKGMHTPFTVT